MTPNIEQIVAEMREKIGSRAASRCDDDFLESEYLDLYPDVRAAVAAGTYRSGYDHWIKFGWAEGRRGRKNVRGGDRQAPASAALDFRVRTIPPHLFDGIGEPTPLLNTARGRISHTVMRSLAKALWWYSHRLRQTLESLAGTVNTALEALQDDLRRVAVQHDSLRSDLTEKQQAVRNDLSTEVRKVAARQESMLQGLRVLAAQNDVIERRIGELTQTVRDAGTVHIPNLSQRIADLQSYAHETRAALSIQERRLTQAFAAKEITAPVEASAPAVTAANGNAGLYVDFEAAFRGSREEIRERQSFYLPILRAAGAGEPDRPIVDLGCGRGEWLGLLREEHMEASGADINESMIEACRSLGLKAQLRDALSHLRSLPDQCAGAMTAFHLVEHLPFEAVLALVDESIRVLKPGGLLILETPNPGNVLVGAQYFYLDPTHMRPLPSPMLRFFVEARGMSAVEVRELHPYPENMRVPENGSELAKRFNDYFYGPRDYAVIARRP